MNLKIYLWLCAGALAEMALGQTSTPAPKPVPSSAPLTLTLQDALARAQMNVPQLLAAVSDANVAHEDIQQARAATRPSLSVKSDYLGTQGNGVFPSGRFVTNDGVHVYREWALLHQDFTAAATRTGIRRAQEAEVLARAKVEITRRGLAATVTRAYYALLSAQRKYATAQQALDEAKRYFDISQNLERGGEVAKSDTVKADLQVAAQDQAFREAKLAMDNARLDLAVMLFQDFDQNFNLVDDLALAPSLRPSPKSKPWPSAKIPICRQPTPRYAAQGSTSNSHGRLTFPRSPPTSRTVLKPTPWPSTAPWRPILKKNPCPTWATF